MKNRHNLLVLTCLLITQAVLAGHLCTAGEKDDDTAITNPSVLNLSQLKEAKINLDVNSSCILTTEHEIPKALASNPKVINLVPISPTKLQLAALSPGVTTVNLWNKDGDMKTAHVVVTGSGGRLASLLDRLYPDTKIQVVPLASSVLLRGNVEEARTVGEIRQIAEDFYPKVINQLTVSGKADTYQRLNQYPSSSHDREVLVTSQPKPELKDEIRALRREVGQLRREIGQLTAAIKAAHDSTPNDRKRPVPPRRSSSRTGENPEIRSEDRVGWPVPHRVRPAPALPRVGSIDRDKFSRPTRVMMEARIFEFDENIVNKSLDKAQRAGKVGREVAEIVRAVVKGQLPAGKGVQMIEGNLVGALDADDKRLAEWTDELTKHDLATVISQPTVVTLSGQVATIHKGGEFPIVVPQALGQVAVEYRQFGTRIEMIPKVVDDQRIRLHVTPNFSGLDTENTVSVNGHTIPSLKTVQIQTAMELNKGQSLIIGGLALGEKRHMIIITPEVVSDLDVATRPTETATVDSPDDLPFLKALPRRGTAPARRSSR